MAARQARGGSAQAGPWTPPPPPVDDFDWIQLKSGEWLKGRLRVVQDRKLEFDSEELDDLTFDLEDVVYIRSGQTMSVRRIDRSIVSGRVEITGEDVTIASGAQEGAPTRFSREEMHGVAPVGKRERDYWSGKASVGVNLRSGNTESTDMTSHLKLDRRTAVTRGTFDYLGNYGTLEGEQNINNHRANLDFDVFLRPRFFGRPVQWEYFRDPFQNIDRRYRVGLSAGYYLLDRSNLEWIVTGGPAYQRTEFVSVEEGRDATSTSPSGLFTSSLETSLTRRIDLNLRYQLTWTQPESGRLIHHSVTEFEIELTKMIDLDLAFTWDRVGEPQPGADGVVPEADDFRFSLLFGVDL